MQIHIQIQIEVLISAVPLRYNVIQNKNTLEQLISKSGVEWVFFFKLAIVLKIKAGLEASLLSKTVVLMRKSCRLDTIFSMTTTNKNVV